MGIILQPNQANIQTQLLTFMSGLPQATQAALTPKLTALQTFEGSVQAFALTIYNLYAPNLNATQKTAVSKAWRIATIALRTNINANLETHFFFLQLKATMTAVQSGTASFQELYAQGAAMLPVSKFNSVNTNVFNEVVNFTNANSGLGTLVPFSLSVTCM